MSKNRSTRRCSTSYTTRPLTRSAEQRWCLQFSFFFLLSLNELKYCSGHYRKGEPGLALFNVEAHSFAGLIPLRHAGKFVIMSGNFEILGTLKFLFSLKCPSPQGGSSLILVTDEFNHNYRQNKVKICRLYNWQRSPFEPPICALLNPRLQVGVSAGQKFKKRTLLTHVIRLTCWALVYW